MKVSLAQTFVCAGLADKQYLSTDLVASTVQLHTCIHTYLHVLSGSVCYYRILSKNSSQTVGRKFVTWSQDGRG